MLILPFIHNRTVLPTITLSALQLLLIGRNTVWSEEDGMDLYEDILHPNGVYLSSPPIQLGDTWLCPVDIHKTNLSDFYKWEELVNPDESTFSWRTVYLTTGSSNTFPPIETLGPHTYKEILKAIGHLNA